MTATHKAPFPWQQTQWLRLRGDIQAQRIAHALLLTGTRGLGKHLFAQALCHSMLCQHPSDEGACGQCKSCQLLAAGNHPDFRFVGLEEKAQAIKIDQVRELVSALAKTPQIGARHCIIIDPADCLNTNAANALLKLLEEPQGDAILILISHYPQRLPATIRSRCQQTVFALPTHQEAIQWLQRAEIESPESLLALAKGAPLLAKQLHDEQGLESYKALSQLLEAVLLDQTSFIDAASTLAARPGTEVVDAMLDWLSSATQERLAPAAKGSDNLPAPKVLSQISAQGNVMALFRFRDKLMALKALLISSANPNKNLLWEECLMDWQALMRTASKVTSGR